MVQLSISSVQREDEGIYQCLASNDEGDWAQASAQLAIGAFPPHLKETFSRQVVHPGSSVSLKCLASGTPLPHFTWTLDGFPLSPVSERYFLGQQQQTGHDDLVVAHLNITHVRVEDGGNYKAFVAFVRTVCSGESSGSRRAFSQFAYLKKKKLITNFNSMAV
ncbi:Down syndrome cell adhesion molecule-like protein Dscam2 [Daphnia magna]|uniref:Down syndrome cell adhesion molecule-like protein Dscam2 n=1 Tax=Daphnia magna TaxID=35525 RepID=UPI001E1BD8B6|nr:Down syndrome cell adhesion molecule-like protein Dscam2 [Daphnia magna]